MEHEGEVALLRHLLGTLAFRLRHALKEAPEDFGDFTAGQGVQTPKELVRHMTRTMDHVHTAFGGELPSDGRETESLDSELRRFLTALQTLDEDFSTKPLPEPGRLRILLHGPLSDSMTHIGQIATLRRLAGSPVEATNYMRAQISPALFGES